MFLQITPQYIGKLQMLLTPALSPFLLSSIPTAWLYTLLQLTDQSKSNESNTNRDNVLECFNLVAVLATV